MRTARTVLTVMVLSLFFFSGIVYGANDVKIGILDFQRILAETSAGKTAVAEINRLGQLMKVDLEKKKAEIDGMKNRIEREILVMSKEQQAQKEREFRIKVNDFKSLQKKYNTDARGIENRLIKRIKIDVFKLAKEIGEKEGFTLIIEKNEAGVLYSSDTIDLSDKLILQYNADFAKESTEKTGTTE
ncbi:MAG: OmpH family outer membrane protein [Deltaproteobacteria bacterium]|nr:OmpH family outer membrane protein [Deltaproteobacteria bacterium]